MSDSRMLAEALREEARLAREEMQQVCTAYLERIDWLNSEAIRLENEEAPTTSPLADARIWKDRIDRAVRLQGMRGKDSN